MNQNKAIQFYNYSVVTEPGDVSFIAGVKQNWPIFLVPVLVVDKVPLLECAILQKPKMIDLWKNRNQNSISRPNNTFIHNVLMALYMNAHTAIAFI